AWRIGRRARLSAAAGLLAGFAIAWIAGEVVIDSHLRSRAMQQVGAFCNFQCRNVSGMIASGLSSWDVKRHGELTSGERVYRWSFRQDAWVQTATCGAGACICYR